ncbi:MAG: GUN4 domain-containing protein [Rhizonema sp. PD37]|nr:GUN4 domain-containing protein [Rhizonema sp. PD37]
MNSSSEIDYSILRNLLAAGEWKEANKETKRVVLAATKSDRIIRDFPCEDLRIIDQLWVEYSNGRFGFSVQKRIYESVYESICERWGRTEKYGIRSFNEFGDQVRWRTKEQWNYYLDLVYDLWAPVGHLPSYNIVFLEGEFWGARLMEVAESIFCCLEDCGL